MEPLSARFSVDTRHILGEITGATAVWIPSGYSLIRELPRGHVCCHYEERQRLNEGGDCFARNDIVIHELALVIDETNILIVGPRIKETVEPAPNMT